MLFTSPQPINEYDTYDNLDFGTVKGFTMQYDLRRTGNIELNCSIYTCNLRTVQDLMMTHKEV